MTKGLFALLLAGALMVPHVTPALGTDSTVGIRHTPSPQANGGALQLPPIPHLDSLRWRVWDEPQGTEGWPGEGRPKTLSL
jgi:hypothetical protein